MPIPVTPTLTPFDDELPDVNEPSTWATRTPLFWNWVTGPGFGNLEDVVTYSAGVIEYLDTALVGAETVIDAIADLQADFGGLPDFTTTGTALAEAANAAAGRAALGSTTVGTAVFTAANSAAARSAIGLDSLPQVKAHAVINDSAGFLVNANFSSASRSSTGVFSFSFAAGPPNANYTVVATTADRASGASPAPPPGTPIPVYVAMTFNKTSSGFTIIVRRSDNTGANAPFDPAEINVCVLW
jgi:hypothetical protein